MHEQKQVLAVGIDVAKAKLDMRIIYTDESYKHCIIQNTEEGIADLANMLADCHGKIVMESTGRYHLLCALMLAETGLDVRVINPLMTKAYSKARIRNTKTDKVDAALLAEMARSDRHLPKSFKPNRTHVQIRQKIGLVSSLEHQIQKLTAILKNYKSFQEQLGGHLSEAEESIGCSLKLLISSKEKLTKELESLIFSDDANRVNRELLISIPGISSYVASLILHSFSKEYEHPKQWIAYIGMDVGLRESGTWHGRGRITKRGSAYLRKRLFSAAWGAVMHNDVFKSYYKILKERGRHHTEALIIISRKILRISFSILKHNKPFSLQYLCSNP